MIKRVLTWVQNAMNLKPPRRPDWNRMHYVIWAMAERVPCAWCDGIGSRFNMRNARDGHVCEKCYQARMCV